MRGPRPRSEQWPRAGSVRSPVLSPKVPAPPQQSTFKSAKDKVSPDAAREAARNKILKLERALEGHGRLWPNRLLPALLAKPTLAKTDYGQIEFDLLCGLWCVVCGVFVCVCVLCGGCWFHGFRCGVSRVGAGFKVLVFALHPDRPFPGPPFPWIAQNFALFFSPPQNSFFSLLSGGHLVEFWWCFLKRRDPRMCTFGVLGLSCEAWAAEKPPGVHTTAREPKRAHFRSGPPNTTRIQREDTQIDRNRTNGGRERQKKSEILGGPGEGRSGGGRSGATVNFWPFSRVRRGRGRVGRGNGRGGGARGKGERGRRRGWGSKPREGWGPEGCGAQGGPEGWGPEPRKRVGVIRVGSRKFRVFFCLFPPPVSFFFSLSGDLRV